MAAMIRTLITLILLCLPYLTTVECRWKGKARFSYAKKIWQTNLPDSRKLNTLAIMGTRDPPTFEPSDRTLPRLLPMPDKLTVGIRVFDMGVRRINDDFAMYNSSFDMRAQFKDLVNDVKTFLEKNPKEFVIMIMHSESTAINSTLSDCEILRTKYVQKYPNLFVQNWSLDDTVGQHRRKILLLEKSPEFSGCTTYLSCIVRDQQFVDVPDDLSGTQKFTKGLQDEVRAQLSKCYLFYYTSRRDIIYPEKFTGNERIQYMMQLNEANVPQTVDWLPDHLVNTKSSLHIIVADLVNINVINIVLDSNVK